MKRNLRLAIGLMIAFFSSESLVAQCSVTFTSSSTDSNCGVSTGSATVNPTDGIAPYTYLWSNGGNTQTINNISAGIYSVTITDAFGCTGTGYVTVNNPGGLTLSLVSKTDVTCYGANDGVATVSASGGPAPYTFEWTPSSIVTATATNLTGGDQIVIATDATSCSAALLVTIDEPAELTAPTGQASQSFCDISSLTVSDLLAMGEGIKWYDAASNGNMFTGSEALVSGNSYFASQSTSPTCESATRLEVVVGEYASITDITPTSPGSVCVSGATTVSVPNSQTGINYYLMNNGMIVDGPVAGTGNAITLNTGVVSSVTTFEVYAENDNTTDLMAKGLRFTGNSGLKKVDLGTDLWDNEFFSHSAITVEAWINRTTTGSLQTVVGNYEAGVYPLLFRVDNDKIRLFLNSGANLYSTNLLPTGTWTHVAATYDGSMMKVYINGVLDGSAPFSGTLAASTNNLKIGGGLSNNSEYFPGDIAEVRFWNVARTDAEIAAMYDKQLIGNENGLVAYYQFEEGTGTTTANSVSGGLYNGTLINAPEWIEAIDIEGANCYMTMSQNVTVTVDAAVTADAPSDVTDCGSYILPTLTTGDYYTGSGATGTMLSASNSITSSQTLYVYAANGSCTDENSFDVTIDTPVSADAPSNVNECGAYELPALTSGDYYTATNAGGSMLTAGSLVTSTATLFVYAANGTCTDENSFDVTIVDLPNNAVTQNAETLTADLSGAQYKWLDCDDNHSVISGETSQSFTAVSNGNYAVEITMNGCADTSACYVIASTDVAYVNGSEISVYPNPSNGMINVNFSEVIEGEIKVYDAVGRLVINLPITKLNAQINLADQKEGIYFVVVEGVEATQTIRVVLE
ncbi:MAG: T9SS type A sorting domain-containing protein [Flavobacteriales bacterium]|nr:T9SS type A sorting domain-containing protein [Flavobacteriales bacterium]MCB9198684.1 T9SS type A sorting domain-containing protein [Flavobacteriales bacterium]